MNIRFKKFLLAPFLILILSCSSPGNNDNTYIHIKTTLGDIKIKLYDETPLHRDNFINLVKSGLYDGVSFHRVIKDFMIQTGDVSTITGDKKTLPDSLKSYTIPAEFQKKYFHKKGALAAAREGNEVNPEMRSSGMQFYIVQGVKYSREELITAEQRINSNIKQAIFNRILKETTDSVNSVSTETNGAEIQEIASIKMFKYLTTNPDYQFSEEQVNAYMNQGGTPRLDGTYTVFGEVIEGLDVVDRIASVATDANDKPLSDIKVIRIKIAAN
jgi:peptidylprolyl isomerase